MSEQTETIQAEETQALRPEKVAAALGLNATAHPEGFAQFSEALSGAAFGADESKALSAELEKGALSESSLAALKQKLNFDTLPEDKLASLNSFMGDVAPLAPTSTEKDPLIDLNAELAPVAEEEIPEPVEAALTNHAVDATQIESEPRIDAEQAITEIEEEAKKAREPFEQRKLAEQEKLTLLEQQGVALSEKFQKKQYKGLAAKLTGAIVGGIAAFLGTSGSGRLTKILASIVGVFGGGFIAGKIGSRGASALKEEAEIFNAQAMQIGENLQKIEAELEPIQKQADERIAEIRTAQDKLKEAIAEQAVRKAEAVEEIPNQAATVVETLSTTIETSALKEEKTTPRHTNKIKPKAKDGEHSFVAEQAKRDADRPKAMAQSA